MKRYAAILIALLAAPLAIAQSPTQIAEAAIKKMIAQDKEVTAAGFAIYVEGQNIPKQRRPGERVSFEVIGAGSPDYYYRAVNRHRIQETEPQITNMNERQFHVDRWREMIKFNGRQRLIRNINGGPNHSLLYQPATVRDYINGIDDTVTPQYSPPLDWLLIQSHVNGYDINAGHGSTIDQWTLTDASLDDGKVAALFDEGHTVITMQLDPAYDYLPVMIITTANHDGNEFHLAAAEIKYQRVGSYWLPSQINSTTYRGVTDVSISWLVGDQAPELRHGYSDHRAPIMEAFRKPYSQIVDGRISERPFKPGPPTLLPLKLDRLAWTPEAGKPLDDTSPIEHVIQVAQQTEKKLQQRSAVLIETECYKSTTSYTPIFAQRWAEQRIYSQLADRIRYGAYNEITGKSKDKHAWEEWMEAGDVIRQRTDLQMLPRPDNTRVSEYQGLREGKTRKQMAQLFQRVDRFQPIGGTLGATSGTQVRADVGQGMFRGELIAARQHPDGTIRSYWRYKATDPKRRLDVRGVIQHNPEIDYLPSKATWYGLFPGHIETEWTQINGLHLPRIVRLIKGIGPVRPKTSEDGLITRDPPPDQHQVSIYHWRLGDQAGDQLFDPNVYDLRAPVMDLYERPFTRAVEGQHLRATAVYKTPVELGHNSDPPNLAPDFNKLFP